MVELRNLKGTVDKGNEQSLIQNHLLLLIKEEFERFGFNPLETPILEFNDILSSKYAGGEEILKEIYTLKDNGERDLALRYDLTVPLCKYIGMNERNLKFPFKRYEIGRVFRDGPVKLGRLREFYQCDADIIGSDKLIYDAECLAIISNVLKKLGKDFYIEINNRKFLTGVLKQSGIQDDDLASSIILSIDKLNKIGFKGVKKELIEKGIEKSAIESVFNVISVEKGSKNNNELIDFYEKRLSNELALEGIKEIKTILRYCDKMGISKNINFRPELARGLSIYTGPVFEAFFSDSQIKSSIAGGGRYDKIIGNFLEKDREIPAVGFSFGLEPLISDIMLVPESYPNIERKKTTVDVMLIPIKIELEELIPLITNLRNDGINCEMYLKKKGIKSGLGLVNFLEIPISVIVGKKELESGTIVIKDMKNEQQYSVEISKAVLKIDMILKKK